MHTKTTKTKSFYAKESKQKRFFAKIYVSVDLQQRTKRRACIVLINKKCVLLINICQYKISYKNEYTCFCFLKLQQYLKRNRHVLENIELT